MWSGEQTNDSLNDDSTFVHTGGTWGHPSLLGSSLTHPSARESSNPPSNSTSAPLRNDNLRSHTHSQSVFAIDQSSSPYDSRTSSVARQRSMMRSQTMDAFSGGAGMKPGFYSECNLQGLDYSHALASECVGNQAPTPLLHSASSRHSTASQSGRSSNSLHERPVSSLSTHPESSSDVEEPKALDTIAEAGTLPEMFVERDVV